MKTKVMHKAWNLYHDYRRHGMQISFSECLKKAWAICKASKRNREAIEAARAAAGITEECRTWYQWKEAGREVIHGSRNVFQVELHKANGCTYTASFFTFSQTCIEGSQEPKAA